MQLGICAGPEAGPLALAAGYDYLELNVQTHLKPEADEADFRPGLEAARACGLPCLAANVFVPGHLKLTGPEVDFERLRSYVATVCRRAELVGLRVIVFGSGGARRIPKGFDRARAYAQLVDFGRMAGDSAQAHGVTLAVEPLNRGETNVLNSVAEGLRYVRDVDHPGIRLLVDAYHWAKESEPPADIVAAGPWLVHAHIATYAHRQPPAAEACDFAPFMAALKQAGYDSRLSVEAGWQDMAAQAAPALQSLRTALAS